MTSNIIVTKSQRGKDVIIHDHYIYTYHYLIDKNTRWRCKDRKCKGYIITNHDFKVIEKSTHYHNQNESACKKLLIMNKIKDKAITSGEKNEKIVLNEIKNLTEMEIKTLPKFENILDKITKARNKIEGFVGDLRQDIPDFLKFDHEGNFFCDLIVE